MKIGVILLLIGILAAFFPYRRAEAYTKKQHRKEMGVYLLLSSAGLALGVMHQIGLFPTIAEWVDDMMEMVFQMAGGSPV